MEAFKDLDDAIDYYEGLEFLAQQRLLKTEEGIEAQQDWFEAAECFEEVLVDLYRLRYKSETILASV